MAYEGVGLDGTWRLRLRRRGTAPSVHTEPERPGGPAREPPARPPPPLRDRRPPPTRDDGPARRTGHAPRPVPLPGEGAQVLPDRWAPPSPHQPARSGGRAQCAGVGLAARGLPGPLRRGPARGGPGREHAVLPL